MREQVGRIHLVIQVRKPGLYFHPQCPPARNEFDHLRAMRRFPFDDRGESFLRGTRGRPEYGAAIRANQFDKSFVNRHRF